MRASTHTEVYRPFAGTLRTGGLRAWPLFAANVRVLAKKKLPLLLLYAPPAIATIVFSFLVYGSYAVELRKDTVPGVQGFAVNMLAAQVARAARVSNLVVLFHQIMVWFTLLVTAWFGSGLFADDRRTGAHQLYFARPLTRLDYALGKLLTVGFYSACALVLPGMWLCLMASFTSPDWEFLRQQPEVIPKTLAYELVWVLVTSLAVLAASSVASKKVFALIGMFALFVLSFAMAAPLGEEISARFFAISPILDVWALGTRLFETPDGPPAAPFGLSMAALGGYLTFFVLVIAWRLRRLEVVA